MGVLTVIEGVLIPLYCSQKATVAVTARRRSCVPSPLAVTLFGSVLGSEFAAALFSPPPFSLSPIGILLVLQLAWRGQTAGRQATATARTHPVLCRPSVRALRLFANTGAPPHRRPLVA